MAHNNAYVPDCREQARELKFVARNNISLSLTIRIRSSSSGALLLLNVRFYRFDIVFLKKLEWQLMAGFRHGS